MTEAQGCLLRAHLMLLSAARSVMCLLQIPAWSALPHGALPVEHCSRSTIRQEGRIGGDCKSSDQNEASTPVYSRVLSESRSDMLV